MSICSICGKEIDRGKKYQNERYKNIIVCSKECYEQLIEIKKNAVKKEPYPDYNVLLDYTAQLIVTCRLLILYRIGIEILIMSKMSLMLCPR